jgi:hypothetical protein
MYDDNLFPVRTFEVCLNGNETYHTRTCVWYLCADRMAWRGGTTRSLFCCMNQLQFILLQKQEERKLSHKQRLLLTWHSVTHISSAMQPETENIPCPMNSWKLFKTKFVWSCFEMLLFDWREISLSWGWNTSVLYCGLNLQTLFFCSCLR